MLVIPCERVVMVRPASVSTREGLRRGAVKDTLCVWLDLGEVPEVEETAVAATALALARHQHVLVDGSLIRGELLIDREHLLSLSQIPNLHETLIGILWGRTGV